MYTLKIKLKDQGMINLDIHEGDSINEVTKMTAQTHKLSNELQEALQIYIQRKLEGTLPSLTENNQSDSKKVNEKS
jgi:hypothetical protein